MHLKLLLLCMLLFAGSKVMAQPGTINGQIEIEGSTPAGVHIINIASEQEAISKQDGTFSIGAAAGDVLIFSGEHIEFHRILLEADDLKNVLKVTLQGRVNELDEVTVINHNFNAVSLGILTKPAKRYTTAERRLYSATSGPITTLINLISGRTRVLKDDVLTEQKTFMLESLEDLYPDEFYTTQLQIPLEMKKGFHYFLVERDDFRSAVKSANEELVTLIIIDAALNFNLRQKGEKQ